MEVSNDGYLDYRFEVSSSDTDVWGFLKPTAILNLCQDVAHMHSTALNFGYDCLSARDLSWVLSRVKVEITRLPQWREKICVRTWHKRQSGLFALRDYILFDQKGEPIMKVTTSWLIINLTSRRLCRVERIFGDEFSLYDNCYASEAISTEAERIELPEEMHFIEDHRVVYSDIDVNRHVNNAQYLEWSCDHSTQQMLPGRVLSGIVINFNHEALFDEVVTLSGADKDADTLLLKGDVAGRDVFAAMLSYRDR